MHLCGLVIVGDLSLWPRWQLWRETTHGKRYAPIVTEEHLKAPVRQRKRKREMDETTKPSIPGKFVLDSSEDMPRKKARSVGSDRGEPYDIFSLASFSDTHCITRYVDVHRL